MKGFDVRKTQDGKVVVTLLYNADPDKDSKEWLDAQRKHMPDERAFRREFLLDWTSAEGAAYYPEFAENPERYIRGIRVVPNLPIYRGWDFGFRYPACVFFQCLPEGRVHVLRELLPSDIDTHSFRDLVLKLSGQKILPERDEEANEDAFRRRPSGVYHYNRIKQDPPWHHLGGERKKYPIPFFKDARFLDFSGPEATKIKSFETAKKERSDADVLAAGGIHLTWQWQPVSYGETIIRRLLLDHQDGKGPGILFHPSCENLINGFAGGLVFAPDTQSNVNQDTCKKDGYHEHLHDALRYAIVNAVPSAEEIKTERLIEPRRSDPTPEEQMEADRMIAHEFVHDPADWFK